MDRRTFLSTGLAGALTAALGAGADRGRPARILLRSSWQTVNIGDIGHTPGVLALIEAHLPGAEVRLWPSSVGDGVAAMLRRRFPALAIVEGREAVRAALDDCDFLLHGSGPSLVAAADVARWRAETGKPYGVYGITVPALDDRTVDLLSGARFVFFRDSTSLELARARGVASPLMAFGPDGAFAVDLRDDAAADAFLAAHGLEPGRFLCCIGRLRHTPYWAIKGRPFDAAKHARNEAMKQQDHAPLREAIIAVARTTPLKILVCPEDASQMAVGKELLVDPLPDDVKPRVVWRERFWLTDEAVSTYRRSAGLFGNEMHSPIMALGQGIPAIVCRWAEQTSKGQMWRDIGLSDWLFDLDREPDRARVAPAVLALACDLPAARAKAERARSLVRERQAETMRVLREAVG